MMTCKHLIEFLDDYVDGRLPVIQRAAFETHLWLCRDCRHYLDSYKTVIKLSRASGKDEAPPVTAMPESLVKTILAIRKQHHD